MKIKLMIISLVAVLGLQGMESSRKDTLTLALNHCFDNESYCLEDVAFINKRCHRPVTIHYFNDADDQYSSDDKIKKIVAGSLKQIFEEKLAEKLTIELYPEGKYLSKDHNEWGVNGWQAVSEFPRSERQRAAEERRIACIFYSISNDNIPVHKHVRLIQSLMSFRRVAFLVNINSSVTGALEILDTLGTEVKVFNKEAAFPTIDELLKSSKELSADAKRLASNISNLNDEDVLGQSSALINRAEQIEKSMYRIANAHESFDKSEQDHLGRAEKIESTAKSFKKSQPGYISTFKNFLINHRGRLAGVFSLTALLVYYYKFVR